MSATDAPLPNSPEATSSGENGQEEGAAAVISKLQQTRKELEPIGKTKILEVPGYDGALAIEYQYINSEATEAIARQVNRETRNHNGVGASLLASIDTLIAGCKRVLIMVNGEWKSISGDNKPPVKFTPELARILKFDAEDERETVLGLFGSEHAITQQNVIYSRWLTNMKRTVDEDFLG